MERLASFEIRTSFPLPILSLQLNVQKLNIRKPPSEILNEHTHTHTPKCTHYYTHTHSCTHSLALSSGPATITERN